MKRIARSAFVFALLACHASEAGGPASAAAEAFTREHARHHLHAEVAGSDCRVLLITLETVSDENMVESIHYGTSGYEALGGAEQFAHERGFRAVVYRDRDGILRTYGATSRDEAKSLRTCR